MFKSANFQKYFEENSDDDRPLDDYYVVRADRNGVKCHWFGRKTENNKWVDVRESVACDMGMRSRGNIDVLKQYVANLNITSLDIEYFLKEKGYVNVLFDYLSKKEVDKIRKISYNIKASR